MHGDLILQRHPRWHWFMVTFNGAYVMDDFGVATEVTYLQVRSSLLPGDGS